MRPIVVQCAWCGVLKLNGEWQRKSEAKKGKLREYLDSFCKLQELLGNVVSHGMCNKCFEINVSSVYNIEKRKAG